MLDIMKVEVSMAEETIVLSGICVLYSLALFPNELHLSVHRRFARAEVFSLKTTTIGFGPNRIPRP